MRNFKRYFDPFSIMLMLFLCNINYLHASDDGKKYNYVSPGEEIIYKILNNNKSAGDLQKIRVKIINCPLFLIREKISVKETLKPGEFDNLIFRVNHFAESDKSGVLKISVSIDTPNDQDGVSPYPAETVKSIPLMVNTSEVEDDIIIENDNDRYTLIDIGTLGGNLSHAMAINNFGMVVGTSLNTSNVKRPFLYVDGKIVDIGISSGGSYSGEGYANDINDNGEVVGTFFPVDGTNHEMRIFLFDTVPDTPEIADMVWKRVLAYSPTPPLEDYSKIKNPYPYVYRSNDGSISTIPYPNHLIHLPSGSINLPIYSVANPVAINNNGDIAILFDPNLKFVEFPKLYYGHIKIDLLNINRYYAFFLTSPLEYDVGSLSFIYNCHNGSYEKLYPFDVAWTYVDDINQFREVTGKFEYKYTFNPAGEPFRYKNGSPSHIVAEAGFPEELRDQEVGTAKAINNYGQIVVNFSKAYLFEQGNLKCLGTLNENNTSFASKINDSGEVVGTSGNKAFFHSGKKMYDLNGFVTTKSSQGWQLTLATDINERGEIVGIGTYNSQYRAFLLEPPVRIRKIREKYAGYFHEGISFKNTLAVHVMWGNAKPKRVVFKRIKTLMNAQNVWEFPATGNVVYATFDMGRDFFSSITVLGHYDEAFNKMEVYAESEDGKKSRKVYFNPQIVPIPDWLKNMNYTIILGEDKESDSPLNWGIDYKSVVNAGVFDDTIFDINSYFKNPFSIGFQLPSNVSDPIRLKYKNNLTEIYNYHDIPYYCNKVIKISGLVDKIMGWEKIGIQSTVENIIENVSPSIPLVGGFESSIVIEPKEVEVLINNTGRGNLWIKSLIKGHFSINDKPIEERNIKLSGLGETRDIGLGLIGLDFIRGIHLKVGTVKDVISCKGEIGLHINDDDLINIVEIILLPGGGAGKFLIEVMKIIVLPLAELTKEALAKFFISKFLDVGTMISLYPDLKLIFTSDLVEKKTLSGYRLSIPDVKQVELSTHLTAEPKGYRGTELTYKDIVSFILPTPTSILFNLLTPQAKPIIKDELSLMIDIDNYAKLSIDENKIINIVPDVLKTELNGNLRYKMNVSGFPLVNFAIYFPEIHSPFNYSNANNNLIDEMSLKLSSATFDQENTTYSETYLNTSTYTNYYENYLVENLSINCQPSFVENDGKILLTYVDKELSNDGIKTSTIKYKYFDGTDWSQPENISNSLNLQFSPNLSFDKNGNVLTTWGESRNIENDNDNIMSYFEIAYAIYDNISKTWSNPEYITNNSNMDFNSHLAKSHCGNVMVTWESLDPEFLFDPDNSSSVSTLHYSIWDGQQWSQPQILLNDLTYITSYDVAYNDNEATLVYSADLDHNFNTVNDKQIFYKRYDGICWLEPVQLTNDSDVNMNPKIFYNENNEKELYWSKKDSIVKLTDWDNDSFIKIFNTDMYRIKEYQLIRNSDGDIGIIYNNEADSQPDIYYTLYSKDFNVCGIPQRLTNDNNLENSYYSQFTSDNKILMFYEKINSQDPKRVDLCYTNLPLLPDLSLEDMEISKENDTNYASIKVNNLGSTPCGYFAIEFLDNDTSQVVYEYFYNDVILPGSTIDLKCELSYISNDQVLYINSAIVDPFNYINEISKENNILTKNLFLPDLIVSNIDYNVFPNGKIELLAEVKNPSSIPVSNLSVTFYDANNQTDFYSVNIPYLEGSSSEYINYLWDLDGTILSSNIQSIGVKIDNNNTIQESNENNNSSEINIYVNDLVEDKDNDILPDYWEKKYGLNSSINDSDFDTDDDGLNNLEEFLNKTNPLSKDTDNDWITDGYEIEHNSDPLIPDGNIDIDNDGLTNQLEYSYNTDPYCMDTDNDGLSDYDEIKVMSISQEKLVNSYTTNSQENPSITSDGKNYLIGWTSSQDSNTTGVYCQFIDNDGNKIGAEFQINSYTPNNQYNIILSSNGANYLALWVSWWQDGDQTGVYGRFLDLNGNKLGNELQVNTSTYNYQYRPRIATDTFNYFTSWDSWIQSHNNLGIRAQLFNNTGNKVASEFNINTYTTNDQYDSWIASNGANYFIVWGSNGQDGSGLGVYGQLYDKQANKIGIEFRINTNTSGDQSLPRVASDGNNYFVIWNSSNTVQDGNSKGIYGQLFDNNGNKLGSEIPINAYTSDDQINAAISSNGSSYVVVWQSKGQDGDDYGIYAQLFDNQGNKLSSEKRINMFTTGEQSFPAISTDYKNYYIVWQSKDQDGSNYGIYGSLIKMGYLTNPLNPDTDNDGLTDFEEIFSYQLNPINYDTDGDGISDGNEILIYHTNPYLKDSDNDGLSDKWEIDNLSNPFGNDSLLDFDNDGLINSEEYNNKTDPRNNDTDNDGLLDFEEIGHGLQEDFEYGNFNKLNWVHSGNRYWVVTNSVNFQGSFSAGVQDELSDNQNSSLKLTFEVNGQGSLSFYFKVSSEVNCDYLRLIINSVEKNKWSGEVPWTKYKLNLSSGTNTIEFKYTKDGSVSNGSDKVWIDNISIAASNGYGTSPIKADTDNDGMNDNYEIKIYHTDPINRDTDNDGLFDGKEILIYHTNSLIKDTDNDGIPDGWEVSNNLNPLIDDSHNDNDNDGLINIKEFNFNSNPLISDTDNDGLIDGDEVNNYGTSPTKSDTDNDLINDYDEVKVYHTNPLNNNTDNDLLTDYTEIFTYFTDPLFKDIDNDEIHDAIEIVFGTNSFNNDTDGDGLLDGDEIPHGFRLNPATSGYQSNPSIASNGKNYFVTWQEHSKGMYGQIFDNEGYKIGLEFLVNTDTATSKNNPSVSSNGTNYMATWESYGQDGSANGIYGQYFDNEGHKVGLEFLVNSDTAGYQEYPSLTSNGINYLVIWECYERIYGQFFDNNGNKIGIQFQVITSCASSHSVASSGTSYFVTWEWDEKIYGQIFDNNGNKIGSEININTSTRYYYQSTPSVSSNGENYFVVWLRNDASGYGIYGQFYDNNGNKIGSEIKVNTYTGYYQSAPHVSSDGKNYIATWSSSKWNGIFYEYGICGQFFDNNGHKIRSEFNVNNDINSDAGDYSLASSGINYFVVWELYEHETQNNRIYGAIIGNLTNPLIPDTDNDGLNDYDEVKIYNTNPLLVDSDGDEIPDFWEVNNLLNPLQNDSSLDYDNEGLINLQEYIYHTDPHTSDTDNDGLNDSDEVLIYYTNPLNPDSDNDSYSDKWEIDNNFNPLDINIYPDTDNDGISDNKEISIGTNPFNQDTDNDGLLDSDEVISFTNPTYLNDCNPITYKRYIKECINYSSYLILWNEKNNNDYILKGKIINKNTFDSISNIQINSYSSKFQDIDYFSCASDTVNYFAIWLDEKDNQQGIYGRLINANGITTINDFFITDGNYLPTLESNKSSYFLAYQYNNEIPQGVSAFSLHNIYGQLLNNDGSKNGEKFLISTYIADTSHKHSLSSDGTNYFIVWDSYAQDGSEYGIFGQLISNNGEKIGDNIQINTTSLFSQCNPCIFSNSNNYLVAWENYNVDKTICDIYGQIISKTGVKIGKEIKILSSKEMLLKKPNIISHGTDYFIFWECYDKNKNYIGNYCQRISSNGIKIGSEFKIDAVNESCLYLPNESYNFSIISENQQLNKLFGKFSSGFGSDPQKPDTDSDNLNDVDEINLFYTNPLSRDSDSDNLDDNYEIAAGYSPINYDSDNDGMDDGWEVNNNLNPLINDSTEDYDNDGLCNFVEFQYQINPYNSDSDQDTIDDFKEINYGDIENFQSNDFTKFEWINNDMYKWVVTDRAKYEGEYSASTPVCLPDNVSSTLKIILNFSHKTLFSFYYTVSSEPNNDLFSVIINSKIYLSASGEIPWTKYQATLNPGINIIEFRYTKDKYFKSGHDSVCIDDILIGTGIQGYGTIPNNSDSDNDGITDGWEVDNNLNPSLTDSAIDLDNDGLTNIEEYEYKTKPYVPDTDKDGMNDGDEVHVGMEPDNAESLFKITYCGFTEEVNRLLLKWQGSVSNPDITYKILWRDDLYSQWNNVIPKHGDIQDNGGIRMWYDEGDNDSSVPRLIPDKTNMRLYKVIVE